MSVLRKQLDISKNPRGRNVKTFVHNLKVELHLHLDGAVRISTICEMARRKGIKIGRSSSYEEIKELFQAKKQAGDIDAIERCAYELCEDQAKEGCCYFETRYAPHLWTSNNLDLTKSQFSFTQCLTPDRVVEAVNAGLRKGERDFQVKARQILCCLSFKPEISDDILRLCKKYANDGVVGIDCAAGEPDNHIFNTQIVQAFKGAKDSNIHRTCHAGEVPNSSKNVAFAVDNMFAERIGHGYHILDDKDIYKKYKDRVHFEVCPYSSYFTGGVVSNANNGKHAIVIFAEDNVSFSINKDDPTIIQTTLDDEYKYVTGLGLNEVHFIRSNLNAAKASFLPEAEKLQLIEQLTSIYGLNDL
ncbi:Adenosine deaminase-like protein [Leptotrombidium deliense]|uniref:adenosine deaminase n=1 Tax=Leptotrombidium deliense TaxID=299467 RepID=A0A443S8V6_9ACAR|nr:Adenosine deaminase-like protein [Leptotrombidium deliense]